ncbi:MAG: substrate-binding domain-containing protein [Zoogloeaceae bacterium]|nr:substrate-binding domain-containing protein [Zoogloeaceae bacterium]
MLLRLLLSSLALLLSVPIQATETLRIGGTGSGTALLKLLTKEYLQQYPERRIELILPTLGSSGGLRALAAGKIDIAISGRPPRADEGQFKTLPFARTPLLFASDPARNASDFSLADIADIYAGRRTDWPDGSPIRLVLRSAFESDTITLRQTSKEMDAAMTQALQNRAGPIGENDLDTVALIGKLPGALGPTTLGLIRVLDTRLSIHSIHGVPPTVENMLAGRYPLSKRLYLNTRQQQDLATTDFIAFLNSPRMRERLLQLGHAPE